MCGQRFAPGPAAGATRPSRGARDDEFATKAQWIFTNTGRSQVWSSLRNELREIVWLASVVGGLSVTGVTLAVILAQALARLPAAHAL